MSFLSVLKKIGKVALAAAPIIAAPFTGGSTLALLGAGTGAASGALNHGGVKGALLGAGLGALPGIGKIAKGAASAAGVAGTVAGSAPVSHGSTFASLLGTVPKVLGAAGAAVGAVDRAAHGGISGQQQQVQRGVVAGTAADQAANNRLRESQVAQSGPSADAAAFNNVRHAGMVANYTPPPAATQAMWDKYGIRLPAIDPETMKYAKNFQDELLRRQAAGEPVTTFGVHAAGPQELADNATARAAAEQAGSNGVQTTQGILQAGSQLAQLAPSFYDIYNQFKRRKVSTDAGGDDPFDGTHGGF